MGLFSIFEGRDSKIRSRIGPIRALCSQLNANHYYGVESVRNIFFSEIDNEMENSNVIVGKTEQYSYCFIEYYHIGRGKNDHSKWVAKASLRLNEESFPNFDLWKKKTALFNIGCLTLLSLPFVTVSLFAFISIIPQIFLLLKTKVDITIFFVHTLFSLVFFLTISQISIIALLNAL